MDNVIVCYVDMFSQLQTIEYPSGVKEKVDMNELPNYLVTACLDEKIDTIHLFGNDKYLTKVSNDILTNSKNCFANSNIKVEVN